MSEQQYVEVTGVHSEGEPTPSRYEIRDILNREYYLSLYLRALTHFQSVPKENVISWFEIGGIHGRPFTPWDNVPRSDVGYEGFCTHSSILFPPWHRSWLALFEQTLYQSSQAVVDELSAQLPPTNKFLMELKKLLPSFRMPYWDWAQVLPADVSIVPEIFREKTWQILGPSGPETINNPLYSHNFGTIDQNEFPAPGFKTWLNTVRWSHGTDPADPNDQGQPDQLLKAFRDNAGSTGGSRPRDFNVRDRIYALLSDTNYEEYKYFSNTSLQDSNAGPNDKGFDSLEGVHNTVHNLIGDDGHMGDTDYACFDPIFALHHTFIDRIFAFWQVLYPNSQMEDQYDPDRQRTESKTTDLAPFHKDQTAFWNSSGVWSLDIYGSNYPELTNPDPAQRKKDVEEAIKVLYGATSPQARLLRSHTGLLKDDGTSTEYFATVRVERHALLSSFNVQIYFGKVDTEEEKYQNLVGTFSVFTSKSDTIGCERCRANAERQALVSGAIPLTGALIDRITAAGGELESLERDVVIEYVKNHLTWEIILIGGTPKPLGDVPSLQVGVVSAVVEVGGLKRIAPKPPGLVPPDSLPNYRDWEQLLKPKHSYF